MKKLNKLEIEDAKRTKALAAFAAQVKAKAIEASKPVVLCARAIVHKDKFIRDENKFASKLKSSDPSKRAAEFVRYAFHKYTPPSFMSYIWTSSFINDRIYEDWYICVATGGSLFKEHTNKILTKKETHVFLNCRHELRVEQAIVYAVCKTDGASDGNAYRVALSRLTATDEFWKHVIRFFGHEKNVTITQINDLRDYLIAKRRENEDFKFTGMGFTLESLLEKMKDWHYALRRMKAIGTECWEGVHINNAVYKRTEKINGVKTVREWAFTQILSAKALQEEGNAQRHCVVSYKPYCVAGTRSIWSLTVEDEYGNRHRKLTIELTNDCRIIQMRGVSNREAKPEECQVVDTWARDNNLTFGRY